MDFYAFLILYEVLVEMYTVTYSVTFKQTVMLIHCFRYFLFSLNSISRTFKAQLF